MNYTSGFRTVTMGLVVLSFVACNSNAVNSERDSTNMVQSEGDKSDEMTKKPNLDVPATDHRFRVQTTLSGKDVLLILNREDVPIGELTDFYLKVEGIDPDAIAISTDTKQGLVSKNKEKYYFGVKGTEGSDKIDLSILVTDKEGNQSSIGEITLPTTLKK